MSIDSKFLKMPDGRGVVIDYTRDEPHYTEENARNAIPDLKRHPNFFEDIRLRSQRAGLAAPPVIIITDIDHQRTQISALAWRNYRQKNVMEIKCVFSAVP